MSDLTGFLLARIAEDEAAARATAEPLYPQEIYSGRFDSFESDHSDEDREFVNRFNPARVVAECEAKRRIVKRHSRLGDIEDDFTYQEAADSCTTCGYGDTWEAHEYGSGWPCPTIKDLASVYADHPDYRQEWKP